MAMSLEDLLSKEGFKGRSSKIMSRTASGPVGGSIPVYSSRVQQKSVSSSNLRNPERRNSDRALHDLRGESPTINRGKDIRPREYLIRREKMDRGSNVETREKFENQNSLDPRDASRSSVDSSGNFSSDEIVEVQPRNGRAKAAMKDNGRYKEIYSNEAYSPSLTKDKHSNGTLDMERNRGNSRKDIPKNKRHGSFSNKNLPESSIANGTSDTCAKEPGASSSKTKRSLNNKKSFNESRSHRRSEIEQSVGEPALDEAAIKALISILSGYIKRFLKEEDFRTTLHHNCFASLNLSELDEGLSESKVIANLEEAIETVERAAEELASAKELKKASLQLSVITGLNANDLKDGFTSGIPNSKLSACGHLYLSVIYKLQKKDRISAKHLLQVFCNSSVQARTMLLSELWERIFYPHLSHLEVWYAHEFNILEDSPSKTRKLKQLQKVYEEILDSGTYQFAVYYKDWLTEGVEAPSVPSISIPSISFQAIQHSKLNSQFSDLGNRLNQFSPQPMVSKKLYESVFGRLYKPEALEIEDHRVTEIDNTIESPRGSVVEDKRTLTYSLEVVRNTDVDTETDGKFPSQDGITTKESHSWHITNVLGERDQKTKSGNSPLWEEDLTKSHALDALPSSKVNELTLMRLAKSVFEMQQSPGSADLIDTFLSRYDDAPYTEFPPTETRSVGEDKFVDGAYFFPSIPQDYICPLTGVLFNDPVTLETGQTYERTAIMEWFDKGNNSCPVTGTVLERQAVPLTNFILKRIIHGWKTEHCRNILASASQMGRTVGEQKYKDETAVCILDNLLTVSGQEEKIANANLLIALGGLQFLFRRFKVGDMKEKTCVASLFVCCIVADSGCRKDIARNIDKNCLLELLQCKQVKSRANAVFLLYELICLSRMIESNFFLNGFEKEGIVSAMHVLLVFLQSSPLEQRPLVAVLLLQLDLQGEPRKYSIYREEAANAFTEALDCSLSNKKARETCCRALLILGRRISFSGKIMTEDWILKQAGFLDGPVSEVLENVDERAIVGDCIPQDDAGEEEAIKDWLMKVSASLLGDGRKSFLETLSTCLGSEDVDLVRVCLTTVAWLSSALASLPDTGLQLSAFSTLISRLKENLENGSRVEHKILASLSLLNFTRIPECRVLLKKISEEITVPLQRLSEVTWTAKELYVIISQEGY